MKIKLRELRNKSNLTMAELSKKIGISSGMISDIENGKTSDPRLSTLVRIADYFNVSLDELVERNLVQTQK